MVKLSHLTLVVLGPFLAPILPSVDGSMEGTPLSPGQLCGTDDTMEGSRDYYHYHHYLGTSKLNFSSLLSIVFGGVSFYPMFIANLVSGSVELGSV